MIKAIIIDDEERARRVLKTSLEEHCEGVEIITSCKNVPDGVLAINEHNPDVVFLDIEMPDYSGFELLGFFKKVDFEIIFVTAYSEYAVRAFEVSAIDYILKPIELDKLQEALNKLRERIKEQNMYTRLSTLKSNLQNKCIKKIAVPVKDGLLFVEVKDILGIDADGSYSKLHMTNGSSLLVSKKLKYFEQLLEGNTQFFRIHRSHIVNLSHITKYSKHNSIVQLGEYYKAHVSREQKSKLEDKLKEVHSR